MNKERNNNMETAPSSSLTGKDGMGFSGLELFANLVSELSSSTKTNEKIQSLVDYFAISPDADKVWVIAIFSGRRPRRAVNSRLMREWCTEILNIPEWLFNECYHTVGDLSETLALLLSDVKNDNQKTQSLSYYLEKFIAIEKEDESIKKNFIVDSWQQMNKNERFVFNKFITGSFRIGVSQKTIVNALAKVVERSPSVIAHRISGNWDPVTTSFRELLSESASPSDFSKPYPFYLAYAIDDAIENLGDINEWQAEWKWDGIRGQMIKRNCELFVWSRGEELMTDKFPEYFILRNLLPDGVVLDGEIIPASPIPIAIGTPGEGTLKPLPFAVLQTRIGRKNIGKKQLQEAPISFFVYDLLEYNYEDWRGKPLTERRRKLEEIITPIRNNAIQISEIIHCNSWHELAALRKKSREMNSEGIMLKRKDSGYKVGRKRGDWWKWKIDPLTIDCVMVYAQKGSGRRSNLYTDYTFAVKDGDKLVTFTKAYSGLTDKEFGQIDNFVKRNSIEKFGPVRTVKPELVFEIAFEGIAASNRHKSGVALRFPRMNRWRTDKTVADINTMDDLREMLKKYGK